MDVPNLEKLAKDIVVERLKNTPDAPGDCGLIARQIAAQAFANSDTQQQPAQSVRAVCRGLMSGMLLLEKDLPRAAVAILSQMGTVAHETHQDPAEMMTWAMEGIAPVAKLSGEHARATIQDAIETAFMGAGDV
ncbi:MAG: hypothetical protein HYZ74_02145, partial [Elusimicrobia bacterium]|nr:hypothetical protein [Elusimicrobiota bacterium]